MTKMDSLEIIASSGQDLFFIKLNDKMRNLELSRSGQDLLSHFNQVLYVFTRPRYQVSVYRTIGSLVYTIFQTELNNCDGSSMCPLVADLSETGSRINIHVFRQ